MTAAAYPPQKLRIGEALTPKTDPLSDYLGKTSAERQARKRKNLYTMNDQKFTKIGKTVYQ